MTDFQETLSSVQGLLDFFCNTSGRLKIWRMCQGLPFPICIYLLVHLCQFMIMYIRHAHEDIFERVRAMLAMFSNFDKQIIMA